MRERVVAVMGAGNLRCGPAVFAAIATWQPDDIVDVQLWDMNEERLDLADRLLRECLEKAGTEHNVVATSDMGEALAGATDIVTTVHEDCARRLLGRIAPQLYAPEEPSDAMDQVRGDPNRPTPPDRLSLQTQIILSAPLDVGQSREEVVTAAVERIFQAASAEARIISLERGVLLPTTREHTHLNWPQPIEAGMEPLVPHQILRWIHGEATLDALLNESRRSPLAAWLAGA